MEILKEKIKQFIYYNVFVKQRFGVWPFFNNKGKNHILQIKDLDGISAEWAKMLSPQNIDHINFQHDIESKTDNPLLKKLTFLLKGKVYPNQMFSGKLSVKRSIQKKGKKLNVPKSLSIKKIKSMNGDVLESLGYEMVGVLGKGVDGLVIDIVKIGTDQHYAAKLLPSKYEGFEDEVKGYIKIYNDIGEPLSDYVVKIYGIYQFLFKIPLKIAFSNSINKPVWEVAKKFIGECVDNDTFGNNGGIIIMEKMDGVLSMLNDTYCENETIKDKMLEFLFNARQAAAGAGFSHGDLHKANVAYKWIDREKGEIEFKIIDIAKSSFDVDYEDVKEEWWKLDDEIEKELKGSYLECREITTKGILSIHKDKTSFILRLEYVFAAIGKISTTSFHEEMDKTLTVHQSPMKPFLVKLTGFFDFSSMSLETLCGIQFATFLQHRVSNDKPITLVDGIIVMDYYSGNLDPTRSSNSIESILIMSEFAKNGYLQKKFFVWAEEAKKQALECGFVHGDLHHGNICFNGKDFGLIDFSSSSFNDIENDETIAKINNEWDELMTRIKLNLFGKLYHIPSITPEKTISNDLPFITYKNLDGYNIYKNNQFQEKLYCNLDLYNKEIFLVKKDKAIRIDGKIEHFDAEIVTLYHYNNPRFKTKSDKLHLLDSEKERTENLEKIQHLAQYMHLIDNDEVLKLPF